MSEQRDCRQCRHVTSVWPPHPMPLGTPGATCKCQWTATPSARVPPWAAACQQPIGVWSARDCKCFEPMEESANDQP